MINLGEVLGVRGVGVDLMQVSRLESYASPGARAFYVKTFTTGEHKEAMIRDNPQAYYAGRFAAKEAVFKSLGIGSDDVKLDEIEILSNEWGQPQVYLHDALKEKAQQKGILDVLLSLTHETDTVMAFAVARGREGVVK